MPKRTPNIFASGRFTLEAPFNTKIKNYLDYTCIAVRSFEDYIAEGELDIFARFYVPDAIAEQRYKEDALEKASIVTLRSVEGDVIHVPDTFITKYPSASSAGWSRIVLSVDLGSVPDVVVLDHLLTVLANATRDTVGVLPSVKINRMVTPNSLTQQDVDLWKAATAANITLDMTDYARARSLNEELNKAVQQINILSQSMIDRNIVT